MAAPIRPFVPPQLPLRPEGPSEAARAAQRAFFNQALGQARGIAQPAEAAPTRTQAVAQPALDPAAPVERLLRPGSLLDIKV